MIVTENEKKALRALTREVRNATGFERTPSQVLTALRRRNVSGAEKACRKIIDDRDMVLTFAKNDLTLRDQDKIPSSEDLGI